MKLTKKKNKNMQYTYTAKNFKPGCYTMVATSTNDKDP